MTLRRRTVLGQDVVCSETGPQDRAPVRDGAIPEQASGGTGTHGDAVVLVHGIGVSSAYFEPLERELNRSMTVLAPDLPGFGRSGRPRPVLSIAEHAEVVAALVDQAGLERPVLVGHSMGVQVVVETAVRHPGLAGGLVLIGPVTDPGARSVVRQGLRLALDSLREPPRGALLQVREWLRSGPRSYLATSPHMRDYPLEERIGQVREPLVLVRGERDPIAPTAYVRRLAARAPDARLVEVSDAAHLAMYRRPEAVAALCRSVRC